MLSQVVELIEKKGTFAITSHLRPDGDSLGSSLGLYWLLRALDKDVEVIMRDPVPHTYQKLPGANDVRVTPAADQSYDGVFVIECSDIARPGLLSLEQQFVGQHRSPRDHSAVWQDQLDRLNRLCVRRDDLQPCQSPRACA